MAYSNEIMELTPENKKKLETMLKKEGIEPNIGASPNGVPYFTVPVDENCKLSGSAAVLAPLQDKLSLEDRLTVANICAQSTLSISMSLLQEVIDRKTKFAESEMIAGSFLQKAMSDHLCNIKLTNEGLQIIQNGQMRHIIDNYKTIPYTRSLYELLCMFYFLFERPKSQEEKTIVMDCWKINSEKNILGDIDTSNPKIVQKQDETKVTIENLRNEIKHTLLGHQFWKDLNSFTDMKKTPFVGSVGFVNEKGKLRCKKLSFAKAWKYMCKNPENLNQEFLYRMLSMHSHPVNWGLCRFSNQSEYNDDLVMSLHHSTIFLIRLCHYYSKFFDINIEGILSEHQKGMYSCIIDTF